MFDKIKDAKRRLEGIAHQTPVITSITLNKLVDAEVFLKCENFQRAGAFKFRGAYNAISKLSEKEKERGVITYSSGNHAQAVALVGRLLNVKTKVVMPKNSPIIKRAAAKDYGAEIILYDPETAVREVVAKELIEKHGYYLIPPFDHYDIIAGHGTAALELFDEVGNLDYILSPCGGGGLLSGTAVA